jgi:hypothetical protein
VVELSLEGARPPETAERRDWGPGQGRGLFGGFSLCFALSDGESVTLGVGASCAGEGRRSHGERKGYLLLYGVDS